METTARRLVVSAAVATGALLLFAPPTFALLVDAVERLLEFLGVGSLDERFRLAVLVGFASGLVASEAAGEIAMIRMHGYRVLRRGGTAMTVARHAVLVLPLLVVAAYVVEFLWAMAEWGVGDGDPTILALSLAVVLGLAWTVVRAAGFYRRGRQRAVRS